MSIASALVHFSNEDIMQQVTDSISKRFYCVLVNGVW